MSANGHAPHVSTTPTATQVRGNISVLFNSLAQYQDEYAANTLQASESIKSAFREFLKKSDFQLALKNFDALLSEKSGEKAYRSDGTVNWYHELVPILMVLDLAKKKKSGGGFNFKDLEPYGGLEVAIISHLRHDSAEDFISREELLLEMQEMCSELRRTNPNHDVEKCQRQIELSMRNIDLMTQKRLFNPDGSAKLRADGKQEKEDVMHFSQRMIDPSVSNPIVIMLKMADLTHNAATLLGAAKFTPQKIQDRCDMMENMYGRRFGIARKAEKLWPEFAGAIEKLDHTMGAVLYPHFRYLENVDLHYKTPYYEYPIDLDDYMENATTWGLPCVFNPLHLSFQRMAESVDPEIDPAKYERLEQHMNHVILPAIAPWKRSFPYLFKANDNSKPAGEDLKSAIA